MMLRGSACVRMSCGCVWLRAGLRFLEQEVRFYFWAVVPPLKVQNSSARLESTHSLLFLVCEWPEIVSIVIDLHFHFDDRNKYFSRPSLRNKCFHSSPSNQSLWAKPRAERAEDSGANRSSLPPSRAQGSRSLHRRPASWLRTGLPPHVRSHRCSPNSGLGSVDTAVNKTEPAYPHGTSRLQPGRSCPAQHGRISLEALSRC